MSRPTFRDGDLSFQFTDGLITCLNTKTGETWKGRMTKLRTEFYISGVLPAPFGCKAAQQLLGVWGAERPAETARIDTKRQGSFRD